MTWEGLPELLATLRALPAELTGDATAIVRSTAEDARAEASAAYPAPRFEDADEDSLRDGMKVEIIHTGQFGVGFRVRHTAFYALWYENGIAGRRKTSKGWNRGPMPAKHVFVPIMIRRRYAMYEELAAMVRGYGLE